MSVTLAVAAVRLAKLDTLVQQMAATESLAAVDTICVDKTGTLTTGELELVGVEVADAAERRGRPQGAGPLRRQLGRAQPHAGGDRRALPRRRAEQVSAEVPFSSEWKWSGLTLNGAARRDLRARRPRRALGAGRARAARRRSSRRSRRTPARAAAWSPSAARRARCPPTRPPRPRPTIAPLALVVLEETLRPDAARDDRVHARAEHGPEADLRRRAARPSPRSPPSSASRPTPGVIEGAELPADRAALADVAEREHDLLPHQARAEEGARRGAARARAASRR